MQRFERAIELAHIFSTPYIRIFSFYPPASRTTALAPSDWGDEVRWRLRALTVRARAENITLLHENEKDIYGDTIARCVDILHSVNEEHFRAILDPANFIQCGQIPYPDAYETLRPWLRYMHVKDALPDGSVVAAGEGATNWPALLQRLHADGYGGFFSLEPHLAAAGQFQGFSGPALFRKASQALQGMLRDIGWEYE
jgi:sugar phosphate isomerase/epimerase